MFYYVILFYFTARTDIPKKIPGAIARFADIYGRQAKGPLIGRLIEAS